MTLKGFRFGMLLQIAVGPICLFIFQTALLNGLFPGMIGVIGVTTIDALYILAAILGIGTLIDKFPKLKVYLKYFGAIVLIVFGLSNILGVFGINIIPSFQGGSGSGENVLYKTMILTLSNPLTILFWAGVFSTKMVEEKMSQKEMYQFGFGAVMATLIFLSAVVLIGMTFKTFVPDALINILNALVGCILVLFGLRLFWKKEK